MILDACMIDVSLVRKTAIIIITIIAVKAELFLKAFYQRRYSIFDFAAILVSC